MSHRDTLPDTTENLEPHAQPLAGGGHSGGPRKPRKTKPDNDERPDDTPHHDSAFEWLMQQASE